VQIFSDADAIAAHIVERCGGEIRMALPLGLGKANTIVNALTRAAVADSSISLKIFTALTLERPKPKSELEIRFLKPAMDRLFGAYPELLYASLLHKRELPDNIEVSEFFLLAGKWRGVDHVQQNYISANYTHAYDFLVDRKPNVVAQLLARDGNCYSLSCNTDISADLLTARKNGGADFMLAGEVNSNLPFMSGDAAEFGEGELDCLLDDAQTDFELFSAVKQPVGLVEQAIGLHASRLVEDGGTLQIGIGSIGDAIAQALLLRQHENEAYRHIIDASPFAKGGLEPWLESFDVGLYAATEMLVDGLLQLFEGGVIKREVDGVAIHAGFFVESRAFYKRLRDMPEERRAKIAMMPVSFTNALYGDEEAKRAARVKARFVNNAMMATLLGAVVSDGTGDGQVVSGVGGQFNFVTQAFALKDARSIITVKATRESGGETVSNIVWSYPHMTIPRHLKDVLVTEYGIADLRGKSDEDTIAALLAVADSRFQDELLDQAKAEGKISDSYSIPEKYCDNRPESLSRWLKPFRQGGKLPAFPFGTDFSGVEQQLLPALAILKKIQNSKLRLVRLGFAGMKSSPTTTAKECLNRMGMDSPAGAKEYAYALLLRGALKLSEEQD